MSGFTIGKTATSKPEYMVFMFDTHTRRVDMVWECYSAKEQDEMYNEINGMPGKPDEVVACKGKMTNGKVELIAEPAMCPCCVSGHPAAPKRVKKFKRNGRRPQ